LRIIDREFITFQIPFIRFITMATNMLQGNALARVGAALSIAVLILSLMLPEVSRAQNVLTQHNDLSRSGANPNETILTTSNVTESTFGKVFALPIDGFTYAQPLYYADVSIAGGTHNVLYVATAHDTVYAFDADSGTEYWHVSLGTPVPSSVIGTGNILVEVGIIATPVIDPSSGTIYVTAKTYESGVQIFRLHALNISTGAEKFGGPVEISAGSFNAAMENQRAAVTLVNGIVYLAFASHEDYTPYHGFVLGYSASTLQQVQVFNVTPNGGQGAIWMGGQGLVADSFNNLYAITANSSQSSEDSADDYGESFIKLVPNGNSLTVADYFKPNQYDSWNASDTDLGSTGAFAIPGTSYIAGGSKSGLFFVVNTNNMGKLDFSSNQSHQEFQATNGLWGSPAFFNNVMYIWGVNEPLKAYPWNGSEFNTSPASQSTYSPPGGTTSGTVSVSSNGTTAGTAIVWGTAPTADPDHATVGGNLYAYDAANLSHLLWSTSQNSSRDSYGSYAKFCAPTIANGRVYMGTDSEQVAVYGLLSTTCTPTAIVPYISVAGVWSPGPESSVTVASGTVVDLGPQPLTGGSWSWTGPNGFTSTVREIDGIPLSAGTNVYTATYTNSCGVKSTQAFTITVGGSFTLSASSSALTLARGSSATDTISVTDVAAFTGSVTLTASGLPGGVTAAFGTNPTTGRSVLTLTASSAATSGKSAVNITGTSGTLTATTGISLTVGASATGSFTLKPSVSTLSVPQGSSATDTITVSDVSPFAGSVTLAASGLPSGVTAAFGTNPTTGSSVLTLTASSSAASGTPTVTISGTSGTLTASTTIALTVGSISCTPTAIVPYISVAGVWSPPDESSVTVASGTVVDLGPQPLTGGSWSWAGPNGFTSRVREIDGIPLSSGVNTYVASYTNPAGCKSTQTFTITATGNSATLIPNGTYIVTAVNSGLALDDPDFSNAHGEDMHVWSVNDGTNQQWTVNNVSSNVITLTNGVSGQLLDVDGASRASGALVDQWPANGQANQQWNVISLGGGAFELTSVNSGLALSVVGGGTANGTDVDQLTYSDSTSQQWKFTAF